MNEIMHIVADRAIARMAFLCFFSILFLRTFIASSSLRRIQIDAVNNQRQLRDIDLRLHLLPIRRWPLEASGFEPLVPDPKALPIPTQQLQSILTPVDERKPVSRSGILLQHGLGEQAETPKARNRSRLLSGE